jgi:hypothetical protein
MWQKTGYVLLIGIVVAALVSPLAMAANSVEDYAWFKFCWNPDEQDEEKCGFGSGNCVEGTLNECVDSAATCPYCNNPAQSKQLIEVAAWGECADASTEDTCDKCEYFYCAKEQWFAEACPEEGDHDDSPTCTVAIGKAGACDPTDT